MKQARVHALRLFSCRLVSSTFLCLFEEVLNLIRIIPVLLQNVVYLFLRFAPFEEVIKINLTLLRTVFILLLVLPLIRYRVRVQVCYVWNSVCPWIRDVNLGRPANFRLQRFDSLFHVLRINIWTNFYVDLTFPLRLLCPEDAPRR